MNMKISHMVLIILYISLPCIAEQKQGIELEASIYRHEKDGHLKLFITNHDSHEATVLTEDITLSMLGYYRGERTANTFTPDVQVCFFIGDFNPKGVKCIPSLPKLCPVSLREGETTCLDLELDAIFMEKITNNPDTIIPISYSIKGDIAERFGLWSGTLTLRADARSLMKN